MKKWINVRQIGRFLNWNKNWRNFCKNIAIGIILAILLHLFFLRTSWGEICINQIFDPYFIKREAEELAKTNIRNSKIVFININPETDNNNRGEPLFTPRDEVAQAIQMAYDGGAKVIFPDILFENVDYQYPEKDYLLRSVLEEMAQKRDVSLILPVRSGSKGDLKCNIFDDIIGRSSNIYRALPGVVASNNYDPVRRYWREYEPIYHMGKPEILWGVPLLIAVLAEGDLEQLENCRNAILARKPVKFRLHLKDKKTIGVSTAREDLYLHRIRFALIPQAVFDEGEAAGGNLGYINIPIEKAESMPADTFQGKIVIIGNPNPDFGDIQLTPIGKMAGMYVIANAINTLLDGHQISGAPLWLWICFDIFIILMTAFFFTFIPVVFKILQHTNFTILAFLLVVILTILFCFWIGYGFYIHYGIFLDSMLLIIMIEFYETINLIEEFIMNVLKNWAKWRKKHGEKVVRN
jgi:CHASE2 domain-containing sensor protein